MIGALLFFLWRFRVENTNRIAESPNGKLIPRAIEAWTAASSRLNACGFVS